MKLFHTLLEPRGATCSRPSSHTEIATNGIGKDLLSRRCIWGRGLPRISKPIPCDLSYDGQRQLYCTINPSEHWLHSQLTGLSKQVPQYLFALHDWAKTSTVLYGLLSASGDPSNLHQYWPPKPLSCVMYHISRTCVLGMPQNFWLRNITTQNIKTPLNTLNNWRQRLGENYSCIGIWIRQRKKTLIQVKTWWKLM